MSPANLSPVLDREDLLNLQQQVEAVKIEPVLVDYILSVITETRNTDHLELGVSPRGGLILQKAAKASALFHGRDYCIPDDIKELAVPVLAHRVIPKSHHSQPNRRTRDTAAIISNILDTIEIPV